MQNLLFEIGTEELPAGFVQPALGQLQKNFIEKIAELRVSHGKVQVMGTPRRLALLVTDLAEKQLDSKEEILGPSKQAGFDDQGNPTRAALGFARSKKSDVSQLQVVETGKGEYLMLVRELVGESTRELLSDLLLSLILDLSFSKSMRWGAGKRAFGRPIQWLLALYGQEVVNFDFNGISSSNKTWGHRFMANDTVEIQSQLSYEQQLSQSHVVVDPAKRREQVVFEINQAVDHYMNNDEATVAIDEILVDTVTNLVESPYGVCGSFEKRFLDLPDEVLITSMREHQKYFPVVDGKGKLLPAFVAVNNTKVADTQLTRTGHERVLRARLEDALFFYQSDKKTKLQDRCKDLSGIIFQAKLGSMLEKNKRIVKLTSLLAKKLAPEQLKDAIRAAELCKADLLSDMVGEFPSLQGVMGGAYALNDGEPESVASAIKEHYLPKRAGAELPKETVGALVGMADRIDTIAGCFGIGQIPTGTADPFGLRRLSLALIHIVEDKGYSFSLTEVIHKALALYGDKVNGSAETVERVVAFIKGRFINDKAAKGADPQAVNAVTSVFFDNVNDCIQRIGAFETIKKEEAFVVLASSFKRIRNIIKDNQHTEVVTNLLNEEAEQQLKRILDQVSMAMGPMLESGEYHQALLELLKLKEPVDNFFDRIMVMVDDERVRQNRLNLLTGVGELVLRVGDISKMQGGE